LTNRWYAKSLHYVVRYAAVALIVYGGMVYLAYGMFTIVPTGFIPTQDQGYLLVNLQMPDASSIERTDAVVTQLSNLALKAEGIQDAFAVSGFSILTRSNSSAAGLLFLRLKPFSQRAGVTGMTADAIANRLRQQFSSTVAWGRRTPPSKPPGCACGRSS